MGSVCPSPLALIAVTRKRVVESRKGWMEGKMVNFLNVGSLTLADFEKCDLQGFPGVGILVKCLHK